WYQKLGDAVVDPGNPIAGSMTVESDGSVREGGALPGKRVHGRQSRRHGHRRRLCQGMSAPGLGRQHRGRRNPVDGLAKGILGGGRSRETPSYQAPRKGGGIRLAAYSLSAMIRYPN